MPKRDYVRLDFRLDDPEFRGVRSYLAAHYPGLTIHEGLRQLVRDGLAKADAAGPDHAADRRAAYLEASRDIRLQMAEALRRIASRITQTPGEGGQVFLQTGGDR